MATILDLVLDLYRLAQDAPPTDFRDGALSMLKGLVSFRTAVWFAARIDRGEIRHAGVHPHGLPHAALATFVTVSRKSPRPFMIAAQAPRRAHTFMAGDLYGDPGDREALTFARRHGQERQLLIADLPSPSSQGEWLSLYRPAEQAPFGERDQQDVALLTPHLSQALAISRTLSCEADSTRSAGKSAADRALVRTDGTLLHCGSRLTTLIQAALPGWDGGRLPEHMLREATRGGILHLGRKACGVRVTGHGDTLLLTIRDASLDERLSPRELDVARRFGAGASHKEIARRIALSPATVRNVVQNAYRKLGINNKAQLARLTSKSA